MDSEFETITVVVGGNDCYSDRLIPDISKNYDKLIKKAKSMCQGRVTMSSICPRLDTVDVQRKIELTNTALKNLCDTHRCRFAKLKSPAVWACLGVYPLDMPRTPYRASEGKRSQ